MMQPVSREEFLRQAAKLYDELVRPQDGETFHEIEQKAVQGGKEMSRLLMEGRLRQEAAQPGVQRAVCPRCGKAMRTQEAQAAGHVTTTCSRVKYERAYCVCGGCGFSFFPGRPKAPHP